METGASSTFPIHELPTDAVREILHRLIPKSISKQQQQKHKLIYNNGIDGQFLNIASDLLSFAMTCRANLDLVRNSFLSSYMHSLSTVNISNDPKVVASLSYIPQLCGSYLKHVKVSKNIPAHIIDAILHHCPSIVSFSYHDSEHIDVARNLVRMNNLRYLSVDAPTVRTFRQLNNLNGLIHLQLYNIDVGILERLSSLCLNNFTGVKYLSISLSCNIFKVSNQQLSSLVQFTTRNLSNSLIQLKFLCNSNESLNLRNAIFSAINGRQRWTSLMFIQVDDYNDNSYVMKLNPISAVGEYNRQEKRPRKKMDVDVLNTKKYLLIDNIISSNSSLNLTNSFMINHGYYRYQSEATTENVSSDGAVKYSYNGPEILTIHQTDLAFLQGMRGRNALNQSIRNIKMHAPNARIIRAWPHHNHQLIAKSSPASSSPINEYEYEMLSLSQNHSTAVEDNYLQHHDENVNYCPNGNDGKFLKILTKYKPEHNHQHAEQNNYSDSENDRQIRHIISYTRLLCVLFKSIPTVKILYTTYTFIMNLYENPITFRSLIKTIQTLHIHYHYTSNNIKKFLHSIHDILTFIGHNQCILLDCDNAQHMVVSKCKHPSLVKELTDLAFHLQRTKINVNLCSLINFLNLLLRSN